MEDKLQASSLLALATNAVDIDNPIPDQPRWLDSNSTKFSIRSTNTLLAQGVEEDVWGGWSKIWKLKVQKRVQVFMWIFSHDRILSNWARWKRKLVTVPCWNH